MWANGTEATRYVRDLLRANFDSLGFKSSDDIYYGIQGLIPTFPAVELQSGRTVRRQEGTHKWGVDLAVLISVDFGKVQDAATNQEQDELIAEAVKDLLHQDHYAGGNVIFSMVTSIDPGVARRPAGVMLRSTLVTWEALSQEVF
jgi:hypothetical protein